MQPDVVGCIIKLVQEENTFSSFFKLKARMKVEYIYIYIYRKEAFFCRSVFGFAVKDESLRMRRMKGV